MWKFFQYLIVCAVVMANVHWQWTPNPYVAGLMGIGLSFVVTVAVARLADALPGITR